MGSKEIKSIENNTKAMHATTRKGAFFRFSKSKEVVLSC